MKKYMKIISALLAMMMIIPMTMVVKAEPESTDNPTETPVAKEPPVKVESFIINSNENERLNATLKAVADTEVHFNYTVSVITDISQDGKEVASGRGKTGEDVSVDINMSNINTHDGYRFKIRLTYEIDGIKYMSHGYSKVFDYTQETYADDLSGMKLTVNMTSKMMDISWDGHSSWKADSVLLVLEANGEKLIEEIVAADKRHYEYYFDQNTKQIKITLKQVFDGKLSKGIEQLVDIEKSGDTTDFYLEMPKVNEMYDAIWSIKYYNATEESKVFWKSDSNREDKRLSGNGSFLIEMKEDNQNLLIEYTDNQKVKWVYEYLTTVDISAPTIRLFESYDGSSVSSSSISLAGKVDGAKNTIKINGKDVELKSDGTFLGDIVLEQGKNTINIEATNEFGKTTRTSITIYKEGEGSITDGTGIFGQYTTLVISAVVSVVLFVILILVSRKGKGAQNEKEN